MQIWQTSAAHAVFEWKTATEKTCFNACSCLNFRCFCLFVHVNPFEIKARIIVQQKEKVSLHNPKVLVRKLRAN